jgi:hypothetical protein
VTFIGNSLACEVCWKSYAESPNVSSIQTSSHFKSQSSMSLSKAFTLAFFGSHLLRSFLPGSAPDFELRHQVAEVRRDVALISRTFELAESTGELCDWKLWRSDTFLKLTLAFDLVVVVGLAWWRCGNSSTKSRSKALPDDSESDEELEVPAKPVAIADSLQSGPCRPSDRGIRPSPP